MARISVSLLPKETEGGWCAEVRDLPGWSGHRCDVNVATVDGEPRVVGLQLWPRWHDAPDGVTNRDLILTRSRLASFPVAQIASLVAGLVHADLRSVGQRLADLARARPEVGDPRQLTTPEQVAAIYAVAREAGIAPRAEVIKRLRISSRTADRYIARARREGLLPGYATQRNSKP